MFVFICVFPLFTLIMVRVQSPHGPHSISAKLLRGREGFQPQLLFFFPSSCCYDKRNQEAVEGNLNPTFCDGEREEQRRNRAMSNLAQTRKRQFGVSQDERAVWTTSLVVVARAFLARDRSVYTQEGATGTRKLPSPLTPRPPKHAHSRPRLSSGTVKRPSR